MLFLEYSPFNACSFFMYIFGTCFIYVKPPGSIASPTPVTRSKASWLCLDFC